MVTIIEMPKLSATMEKGKVVQWYKEEGDDVEKGEILFEVETDKANVEIESYADGFLRKVLVEAGVEVPVNTSIALIADSMDENIDATVESGPEKTPEANEPAPAAADLPPSKPAAGSDAERRIIKISPLARRLAKEHGLDIESLVGAGPEGRIVKADVLKAAEKKKQKSAAAPSPAAPPALSAPPAAAPPVADTGDAYQDIELTKMRKVIAERLSESKRTAPHFYIDMTTDATALMQLRGDLVKKAERLGTKVTYNDIVIKLVSQALKEMPTVNASYQGDRIRVHRPVNIGVAVGVDEGLIVPVIKDVDRKTISEISLEMKALAEKARNKKLLPEDYTGGTFTVTNLGMFGVETFHAIINPPESAILAVSSLIKKPVVVDDEIRVRPCMTISLSIDHRVIDGVLAAKFLGRVKELIETPYLLFA